MLGSHATLCQKSGMDLGRNPEFREELSKHISAADLVTVRSTSIVNMRNPSFGGASRLRHFLLVRLSAQSAAKITKDQARNNQKRTRNFKLVKAFAQNQYA